MERRKFIRGAALGGAAATAASTFPKPAISQNRMEWRMVSSWPKGLPGLGTGAERLAARIGELTDGRLTVKYYAAGELVPALEVLTSVGEGAAEMGHDASYYHIAKNPAWAFFTAVPFGMTASEMNAWIYFGGGQELWDELGEQFNVKCMPAGNTGDQMGGWFREPIQAVGDLQGLKMRIPGIGGRMMEKVGVTVVTLPGGEIFQNLQSGAIDATEWVGPYNDLSLGFYQVAKNYYWPGLHEPGPVLECVINKDKWESLPNDLQLAITTASAEENVRMLAEYNARSAPALRSLVEEHQVQLRQMPRDVIEALGNASGELMEEYQSSGDAILEKVAGAFLSFRTEISPWTRISEWGYLSARQLNYNFPKS